VCKHIAAVRVVYLVVVGVLALHSVFRILHTYIHTYIHTSTYMHTYTHPARVPLIVDHFRWDAAGLDQTTAQLGE
jgi:hypothetical protein